MGVNNGEKEKDAVAAGYGTLMSHQQRVVNEKAQNDTRLEALAKFFDSAVFARLEDEDKFLLRYQYSIMKQLSGVLGDRIARF
ncbi:crAss001_48 related protein [Paraburkholderia sp.]|uniref:crAss001_48 related protein n=1 Tax=Paraburkholderia sp. TaxID=1926495 RepID=UPI0039E406E5